MMQKECPVISNQMVAKGIFEMVLDSRGFPASRPGQFVMLYLDRGDMLLPRPISICKQGKNVLMLVYKVVGAGTEYLSTYKPGDGLRIMGPLGNGFVINKARPAEDCSTEDCSTKDRQTEDRWIGGRLTQARARKVALVGGGIGIPPLVSLFSELRELAAPDDAVPDDAASKEALLNSATQNDATSSKASPNNASPSNATQDEVALHYSMPDVFLGFRDDHFLTNFFSGNVYTTNGDVIELMKEHTKDRAKNHAENHTKDHTKDHAKEHVKEHAEGHANDHTKEPEQNYDEIFACGPKPMLEALARYAKEKNIPLQVSLEERMACGVGTCMGCVTPPTYMKICCDGPVFSGDVLLS